MDLNKNYYQILGVDKNADDSAIKKSYRKLANKHHPDKGGSEDKFQELNEANTVLSGDERDVYDMQSPHGQHPMQQGFGGGFGGGGGGFGGVNLDDLFRNGFGRGSGFPVREELDLNMSLKVSLKEIFNNSTKTVKYNRKIHCKTCDGVGRVNNGESPSCRACNGSGRERYPNGMEGICKACHGTGKIHSNCKTCDGTKLEDTQETLKIDFVFIAGGGHAKTVARPGLGNASKESISRVGDLNITLVPLFDKKYEQKGLDLYYTIKVDIKTAILGGKVRYVHLDDKSLDIKIPPKTKNGDIFRMSGKGLMRNREGSRGDFYVKVELDINYDKLNDSDLKLIENINF